MARVLLLSFDPESLPSRRRSFEEAGFTLGVEEPGWPRALEAARKLQPDVIAVDCEKLPSHARETAEALRRSAETRDVPVVLFRVADHDIERTRLKVPGGVVAFEYELIDRLKSAALTRLANQAAAESAARAARSAAAPRTAAPASARAEPRKAAAKKPAARKPAARKAPARKPARAARPAHRATTARKAKGSAPARKAARKAPPKRRS